MQLNLTFTSQHVANELSNAIRNSPQDTLRELINTLNSPQVAQYLDEITVGQVLRPVEIVSSKERTRRTKDIVEAEESMAWKLISAVLEENDKASRGFILSKHPQHKTLINTNWTAVTKRHEGELKKEGEKKNTVYSLKKSPKAKQA